MAEDRSHFGDPNLAAVDLAVGRSSIRRRILSLLMATPEQRLHLREIQRRVDTTPGTASRELGRLVAAGLVERAAEGRQVYFRSTRTPVANAVRSLILVSPQPLEQDLGAQPAADAGTGQSHPSGVAGPTAEGSQPDPGSGPDPLALKVAARLGEVLRRLYAKRLVGMYLNASRAKGDSRADADVEFVVVLDHIDRYGDELERTSLSCAKLSLEFEVIVSRVFLTEQTWMTHDDGLLRIRQEAVAI